MCRGDEIVADLRCVIQEPAKELVVCCVDNEGFDKGHSPFSH